MDPALVKTSKFLSLVLRHRPEKIGLVLDEAGWTSIAELLELTHASGRSLDHDLLLRVVRENDQQRYAISDDGCGFVPIRGIRSTSIWDSSPSCRQMCCGMGRSRSF